MKLSLTLYFLRHGETIYSETGAYCGEVDPELTPEGAQMAEAFAQAYRSIPWTAGRSPVNAGNSLTTAEKQRATMSNANCAVGPVVFASREFCCTPERG
jgi:broad specificity phosphatase PhoE